MPGPPVPVGGRSQDRRRDWRRRPSQTHRPTASAYGDERTADRPALCGGDSRELGVWIDGDRKADRTEHREVGDRVGVRVGLGEPDSLGVSQLDDQRGLAAAVGEHAAREAGIDAVDNLRPGAERAVEAEHERHQVSHLLGGRRADVDPPAGVLVRVGEREDARVEIWEHAAQDVMAEAVQLACRHPGHQPADPLADVVSQGVGRPAEPKAEVDREIPDESRSRDQSGTVGGTDEVDPGRPLDQGAVEVEERGTRRHGAGELGRGSERRGYGWTLTITRHSPLAASAEP